MSDHTFPYPVNPESFPMHEHYPAFYPESYPGAIRRGTFVCLGIYAC